MQGQIRTYFEIEARELIDRLTRGALHFNEQSRAPGYKPAATEVQPLERAAHTLKGAAHVVNEPRLAGLAHDFEDALAGYAKEPAAERASALVRLVDELAMELARSAEPEPIRNAPTAERITQTDVPAELAAVGSVLERTVRVGLGETERLLEQIGESARIAAALRRAFEHPRETAGEAPVSDQLDRLDRTLAELYRVGSQLRLIPLEDLLLEAGRMVRATAAALEREVICVTHGGRERIDVHVIETFESALLHLVRNAVAHGIEPAAERRALGKPVPATVTVSITRWGSELHLTCADDGRGIDPERIRAAAVAHGSMTLEGAAQANSAELLALLFAPGFTTAPRLDHISGRGVGLDAVRSALASIHGTVDVDSTPGRGTTFTLCVPETLAAVVALEVLSGDARCAIPLAAVEQTFVLGRHRKTVWQGQTVQLLTDSDTLLLGHEILPVLHLADAAITGSSGSAPALDHRSRSCVIVRDGEARVALEVDSLGSIGDVLARPLPGFIQASDVVAGAVLRADGEPMLLLDPAGLVRLAASRQGRAAAAPARPQAAAQEAKPDPILVIDDSLTTRILEQSILEAAGYEVVLASSAEEGLERARSRHAAGGRFVLFLVDVEMPGMNGFQFVRTVQADAVLKTTPAILVTSLDSAASRAEGIAAGAESYIVKGEFHQQQYLDRVRALAGPPAKAGPR